MTQTTALGARAEELVRKYLTQNKCIILDQNWRNRFCEIDIVAKDKRTFLFVEVKYRASNQHGGLESVISPDKIRRLRNAVSHWCLEHDVAPHEVPIRIDVAYVSGSEPDYKLNYLKNSIGIDE